MRYKDFMLLRGIFQDPLHTGTSVLPLIFIAVLMNTNERFIHLLYSKSDRHLTGDSHFLHA